MRKTSAQKREADESVLMLKKGLEDIDAVIKKQNAQILTMY